MATTSIKIDYVSKLNQVFLELLVDLQTVVPNDKDIRLYTLASRTALGVNKRLLYEIMSEQVMKYEDKILLQDEDFFQNFELEEGSSDKTAENNKINDVVRHVISKLKNVWAIMSKDDKTVTWKYLRTLVLIHHRIV